MGCEICPRKCGVDRPLSRKAGTVGFCGQGTLPVVARAAPHFWEEPCISGSKGSGTVFFSGCPLHCVFCQNDSISRGDCGRELTVPELAQIFVNLAETGVHNLNLVTATHFSPAVAEALKLFKGRLPVVWNSGGYELTETLKMLEGLVDVYLPDLKFMDPETGRRYAAAPDYFEYASAAILEMYRQVGPPVLDGDGIIRRGLIVRHLVLPGHTTESMRILDWLREQLPPEVMVSLMGQYLPLGRAAEHPEISRRLLPREYRRVTEHMDAIGLHRGYVQELSAADEAYIPPFDLTGVR